MMYNLHKTLFYSGKLWILAIAAIFASAVICAAPAEAEIAEIGQKDCAFIDFDRYAALYYRQTKEKEVKASVSVATQVDESSRAKKQASLIEGAKNEQLIQANESLLIASSVVEVAKVAKEKPDKVVNVVMTAYTSTPDQTDDSPFIAASGKHVYDGMLAANWLPMGTKVKIPELYGDKIFTVDDRMNKRYGYGRMDIWLDATKAEARQFGVKRLTVEVYYEKAEPKELAIAK
jgi:3D (Asp-Asp-Asp) domain-containing protein